MINTRVQNIYEIVKTFTGKEGEPSCPAEFYILKSMWIMMLAEFEGSVKDLAETYIDKVKTFKAEEIHICLLLQNFYSGEEENLTINKILSVHKKNPQDINYMNFTRDFRPKYKSGAIEKLFNTLGIFFSQEEIDSIKIIDGIASTRDSIAHGDSQIQITRKELERCLLDIEGVFDMLKSKLTL